MLRATLFIADPQMATLLRRVAGESSEFIIDSIVELGGTGYAIKRTAGTARPDVLLLEMSELERDLRHAAEIHAEFKQVPMVGLASRTVESLLSWGSHADLAAVVVWPFTGAELAAAIHDAVHKYHHEIHENLVAFIPGKAGSGASTVVLNTACVLGQELKRRVLVLEGDLHSGLLAAMLRVEPKCSIREVLAEAGQLGTLDWQRSVCTAGGADFLLTNTVVKEPVPSWTHYFQLLRFALPKYDLIMVDLPEIVNSATAEIVRRSRAVYVVSTPEFASLTLTKQRCGELEHWGVERARIQTVLNRGQKSDIGAKDAERILQCPVAVTLPNDYRAVQRATTDAAAIDRRSELGEAYSAFARMLVGEEAEKKSFRLFRK